MPETVKFAVTMFSALLAAFALGYVTCALIIMAKWEDEQTEMEARALTENRPPKTENQKHG